MSEMELFVGRFKVAEDQSIFPEDTDEFYEWEESQGVQYVRVNGIVYEFWSIMCSGDLETMVLPPQDGPILFCYWYNGGGGIYEVVESALKKHLADT
jgi:hypothetical protein